MFRKIAAILAVVTTTMGSIVSGFSLEERTIKAAITKDDKVSAVAITEKKEYDTVDLRMVFTTDLHGMLSSTDYLSGNDFKNQGLSLAYPLINLTREEKPESNVFTFDIGDVLFEASMEYIYGQDEEALQPIYQGMSMVGYDAITLGNHDFDYGKNYLLRQLTYSGLLDKTVVSNLQNTKDNRYPFHENMIIERQAVTQQGKTVPIKVGVIGETIPTLSQKTDNYTGIWKTEDIVANVKKEAALLKSQGADVIVVLAHSGFGAEEPVENADNVSYALTKVEDVDVILCGHEHNEFPSATKSGAYYNYPGVDAKTGLVNDKLIVMARSQGRSIGVADLTLSYDKDGNFKIEKQAGEVRRVSDYKLKEDNAILSCMSNWKEELETYRTKQLIELADGVTLQNYLGLLGDSPVLQLQNDARIAYARKYIESVDKTYSGYPVIAAASHISYGANSMDDYVDISGSISTADLFTVQNYRNYTYLYKITGAQLKEWLELSASIYNTLQPNNDEKQFLINPEYFNDWSKFFVFDGINYTINPYAQPRYDLSGKKINNSNRVSNIMYEGKPVSDDMEFIIACNTISPTGIFSWAADQKVKGMYRTQNIIIDYLTSLNLKGKYTPTADHNWTINFKEGQEFLMLVANQGSKYAKQNDMYEATAYTLEDRTLFEFKAKKTVKQEPHIVALQSVLEPTNKAYAVYVDAFSSAGIKSMKYVADDIDEKDSKWYVAREIKNNQFMVYFNATYTILVEDNNGVKSLYKVVIDNIGAKEMAAPRVWSFNNTKTTVTGRAEANAKVYVKLPNKTYSKKANSDGSYSITIPAQISGTSFYVWAEDKANDRKSAQTKVYVKYAGPNVLAVDNYSNTSQYLTGKTVDKDNFIIVIDSDSRTVYVPNEETAEIVKTTESKDFSKFEVIVAHQEIDEDGSFRISLPNIEIKSVLTVVNMDYVGRMGVNSNVTVTEGGPYAPEFVDVVDTDDVIYGNVTSVTKEKNLSVVVNVDGTDYMVTADKNGYFKVNLKTPITPITTISAYAKDTKDGSEVRKSRVAKAEITSIISRGQSKDMKLSKTAYNSTSMTVTYLPDQPIAVLLPLVNGDTVVKGTTDAQGKFTVKIKENMKEGTLVKVTSRNNLGHINDSTFSLVAYRQPTTPVLITAIDNSVKHIKVVTKEDCKLVVTMDDQTLQSEKGKYVKENGGYVHVIKFNKRLPSGTKISMYAQNATTNSKRVNLTVKKKAPDAPTALKVQTVTNGAIQLTGEVELFLINSEKEPTVKLTKTAVFAKMNGVNYKGKVNEDGTFTITLPAITQDTDLTVYAYNRYGYGPEKLLNIIYSSASKK